MTHSSVSIDHYPDVDMAPGGYRLVAKLNFGRTSQRLVTPEAGTARGKIRFPIG